MGKDSCRVGTATIFGKLAAGRRAVYSKTEPMVERVSLAG